MKARIIGPASELGTFESLEIAGQSLTREWSDDFKPTPDQLAKLRGNRFVEIQGAPSEKELARQDAEAADQDSADTATVKARLDELGVAYPKNANAKALQSTLDKAEKAQAKAEEEAEKAKTEADRLAAEADPTAPAWDETQDRA